MSRQNIYDNPEFYAGYGKIRDNSDSANNREEKPALFELIGSVAGLDVLDLGCGYGENCLRFQEMGANRITGIDISEKMLKIAREQNGGPAISYLNMAMEDLETLKEQYDVIVSSLAFHYIKDYDDLLKKAAGRLKDGGLLVFSQEHPLTTAPLDGPQWIEKEEGTDHYRLTDYGRPGIRQVDWIVKGVVKYHRTFSQIVNGLARNGFWIQEMREPVPEEENFKAMPRLRREIHKPNFLIIKAVKAMRQ